jgi:hypothetical protein
MNIIKNYQDSLQAIYDHVGFTESWVVYPIDDQTDMFWNIYDKEAHYAYSIEDLKNGEDNYYNDSIYTQRLYNKWIYEGKEYTMIFCDPHVDGMKWFRIFDNTKRIN